MDTCDQSYPRRGDIARCLLPFNHDDDCATANRAAADTPATEARNG